MVKMVKHSCFRHAAEKISTKKNPYHFVGSGLSNVYLIGVKYYVCRICKKQAAELPAVVSIFSRIQNVLVRKATPLTGEEITFLRKQVGKSSREFARMAGVSPEHLSRCASGQHKASPTLDKYIRSLVEHGEPDEVFTGHRISIVV